MSHVMRELAGLLPAYGYVNDMREQDGNLIVAGWMMLKDGPFDAVHIRCDDPAIDVSSPPMHVPALAEALRSPAAARAAFQAEVPIRELPPSGTLELVAVGMRGGVPAGFMTLGYHRPPQEQDYPPAAVMRRATVNEAKEFWRANGIKACNDFRRAMAPHIDLDGIRTLLDWGCGAGRVTKHLIDRLPQAKVYGADIDGEAVQWAAAHLGGDFTVCRIDPPLPYRDGQFDAVVSLSVFTHLTWKYQKAWLRELRRIVRPGGIVAATTHGDFAARWSICDSPGHRTLRRRGFFDGMPDHNLKHVASPDYYRSTFQTREYTAKAWGKWFDVVDCLEGGINNLQDLYVLRRP